MKEHRKIVAAALVAIRAIGAQPFTAPPRRFARARLRLRFTYAEWSRAADKGSFPAIRQWLAGTQEMLNR